MKAVNAAPNLKVDPAVAGVFKYTGIWRHKWRPILFCLIVDDFGIEYVGKRHADHLRDILLDHYELTQDWSGS